MHQNVFSFFWALKRKEGRKERKRLKKEVASKALRFFLLLPKRGHLVDKIRTARIRNNVGRERNK